MPDNAPEEQAEKRDTSDSVGKSREASLTEHAEVEGHRMRSPVEKARDTVEKAR